MTQKPCYSVFLLIASRASSHQWHGVMQYLTLYQQSKGCAICHDWHALCNTPGQEDTSVVRGRMLTSERSHHL